MPRLSQRTIDAVKERAQIVDVMEGRTLKRMGREFVTQCPWHDDHKPSLSINPQKGFAYCHVCQHGVDPLGWLQDQHGMTFAESVEHLARRYNVPVEMEDAADNERLIEERKARAVLYRRREQQEAQFRGALFENVEACLYLKDRQISKATAETWGLGFNDGRLMVPLRDSSGRTIAFTGRALGDQLPKYKNSPNDLLFDKSRMVFGLDRAASAIRKAREVVVVEGQFDVIQLHQEGLENVVACSGTALTAAQIEQVVKRCGAETVTLAFDGDAAGEKAAFKALEKLRPMAISETIRLRILSLNPGDDPDSLCRERGVAYVRSCFAQAPNWVEWWFDRAARKFDPNKLDTIEDTEKQIREILAVLPEGPRRAYVMRRAFDQLGAAPTVRPAPAVVTKKQRDAFAWAERRAVRCYLLLPSSRPALREAITTLEVPPWAEAWLLLNFIEETHEGDAVGAMFGQMIRGLPENDFHQLRSILQPVPEVLEAITRNPERETTEALEGVARLQARKATADESAAGCPSSMSSSNGQAPEQLQTLESAK